MGLRPALTGTLSITTTPVNITSTGYYYHHITIYVTTTIGSTDSYEFLVLKFNPISQAYQRMSGTTMNLASVGGSLTATLQNRVFEVDPRPGSGIRVTVTKLAGNNGTLNYEIVQAL